MDYPHLSHPSPVSLFDIVLDYGLDQFWWNRMQIDNITKPYNNRFRKRIKRINIITIRLIAIVLIPALDVGRPTPAGIGLVAAACRLSRPEQIPKSTY
jgi:hypothetical protein